MKISESVKGKLSAIDWKSVPVGSFRSTGNEAVASGIHEAISSSLAVTLVSSLTGAVVPSVALLPPASALKAMLDANEVPMSIAFYAMVEAWLNVVPLGVPVGTPNPSCPKVKMQGFVVAGAAVEASLALAPSFAECWDLMGGALETACLASVPVPGVAAEGSADVLTPVPLWVF